jgi:hypothetical protein
MEVAHVPRRAALKMCREATGSLPGQVQRVKWRSAAVVAGAVMGSATAVLIRPVTRRRYEVQYENECL